MSGSCLNLFTAWACWFVDGQSRSSKLQCVKLCRKTAFAFNNCWDYKLWNPLFKKRDQVEFEAWALFVTTTNLTMAIVVFHGHAEPPLTPTKTARLSISWCSMFRACQRADQMVTHGFRGTSESTWKCHLAWFMNTRWIASAHKMSMWKQTVLCHSRPCVDHNCVMNVRWTVSVHKSNQQQDWKHTESWLSLSDEVIEKLIRMHLLVKCEQTNRWWTAPTNNHKVELTRTTILEPTCWASPEFHSSMIWWGSQPSFLHSCTVRSRIPVACCWHDSRTSAKMPGSSECEPWVAGLQWEGVCHCCLGTHGNKWQWKWLPEGQELHANPATCISWQAGEPAHDWACRACFLVCWVQFESWVAISKWEDSHPDRSGIPCMSGCCSGRSPVWHGKDHKSQHQPTCPSWTCRRGTGPCLCPQSFSDSKWQSQWLLRDSFLGCWRSGLHRKQHAKHPGTCSWQGEASFQLSCKNPMVRPSVHHLGHFRELWVWPECDLGCNFPCQWPWQSSEWGQAASEQQNRLSHWWRIGVQGVKWSFLCAPKWSHAHEVAQSKCQHQHHF